MRKAWKWILLLLGVLLASAGLLVWDANARAARVIEAYEARLKADIAALRARFEVIPRTPDEDVLRFEMGHSGQGAVRNEVFASLRRNASSRAGSSPLEILGVLGKYELTLREGGYRVCSRRTDDEAAALRLLRSTLVDRPMEPHELRRIADGVDWLRSLRPSLADLVGAESALDRAEILNGFRLKQDPFGMIRKGPGWRELFSWRIRIAKSLALLDDSARELRGALLLPTADQKDCLVDFESPGEAEACTLTLLRRWAAITLDHERDLQVHFGFTRVAVALALFKAEKGKFPEQPASLAPEYLAEAFVPAPGWNSYKFSRGRLREVSLGLEWPEKQE